MGASSVMHKFFQMLPAGESYAVTTKYLSNLWNLSSAREVRRVVHRMRRDGLLVCSGNSGYWRPETPEELQRFVKRLHGQAKAIFVAAQGAARAVKQV